MTLAQRYVDAIHASAHSDELLGQPLIARPSLMHLLADDECVHGRLAGDRTPPCPCWPQRRT